MDRIVKEFYANLTNECVDENSFMYEKVYVRGSWCSFSPKDIVDALGLPYPVETIDMPFDRVVFFVELTGNPNTKLQESMHISQLTYHYAVLMRFALSNWFLCSNAVNVSNELAFFLFKLSTGVPIDMADTIYEQIMSFRKGKNPRLNLIFLNLIYKILSSQHELIFDNEVVEAPTRGLAFKIIERPSQAKGTKKAARMESPDDTDTGTGDASTLFAATKIAALNVCVTRVENGQHQILRKLESILEKLA